jgi:hypothetical protein
LLRPRFTQRPFNQIIFGSAIAKLLGRNQSPSRRRIISSETKLLRDGTNGGHFFGATLPDGSQCKIQKAGSASDLSRCAEPNYQHGGGFHQVCGQCRSRNQARYAVIFARCAAGACRLQVEVSSPFSGAPHRNSTQSFGL